MIKVSELSHGLFENEGVSKRLSFSRGTLTAIVSTDGFSAADFIHLLAGEKSAFQAKVVFGAAASRGNAVRGTDVATYSEEDLSGSDLLVLNYLDLVKRTLDPTEKRLRMAINELQLNDLAGRRVRELTRSQKARLLFAVVFLSNSRYLLLDDPVKDLGGPYLEGFLALLRHETARGKTIVMSCGPEDVKDVEPARQIFMDCGRVVLDETSNDIEVMRYQGTSVQVRERPALIDFLGTQEISFLEGEQGIYIPRAHPEEVGRILLANGFTIMEIKRWVIAHRELFKALVSRLTQQRALENS